MQRVKGEIVEREGNNKKETEERRENGEIRRERWKGREGEGEKEKVKERG